MREFVFWQRIVSPHMTALASALAARGAKVTYVAEEVLSAERAGMGWSVPEVTGVRIEVVGSSPTVRSLTEAFPEQAIHLTQGVWRNGYVARVVTDLRRRRGRWGAMVETVDDRGLRGWAKRVCYSRALGRGGTRPDFVLAIGDRARGWIVERGVPEERVFPFAYFLAAQPLPVGSCRPAGSFRVGFVGQMVALKRLDLLVEALSQASGHAQLVVIGAGPLEEEWRRKAETLLGVSRVFWLGRMSMVRTRDEIATLDCLVLPSDHDGWGAVVSEALMAGVPVICSDACGAAVAVRASGVGGVFRAGDIGALRALLEKMIAAGALAPAHRVTLAEWANCLANDAGAGYLDRVIDTVYAGRERPRTPWCGEPVPRLGGTVHQSTELP